MNRLALSNMFAALLLVARVAHGGAAVPPPPDPPTMRTPASSPMAEPAPHATAQRPALLREIVLVRHGHYVADETIDATIGPGLSPVGVAQARLVAHRLDGELPRADGLYVSPMQRARDTAASIEQSFPAQSFNVVADMAECTPPTRRKEIMANESPESVAACTAQLDRLFARFFESDLEPGRTDVLVCHGNVIRYLVARALDVDTTAWLEMSVGHASVTRVRIEGDGRYKIIAVGDVGHIPPNLRTGASGDPERNLDIDSLRLDGQSAAKQH